MSEPQYIVREGQLQVVKDQKVIFTRKVQINDKGDYTELVVTPKEEGEVRIPVSALLEDGTFTVSDFASSEKLAAVTRDKAL